MNKPTKPNITIPESFAANGVKADFDDNKILNGFDRIQPDVLAGDNLNKFIDDTYKGLNYGIAAGDAINLIQEGETLTVKNGQLVSGSIGGSSRNIGETIFSLVPLTDAGLHLLDGSLIQGDGMYAAFVDYIAVLYNASETPPAYFTTEDEWQSSITTYGVCGKFVYDSENNTVRLPKVTGFVEGTLDASALGELTEAGLPNITGSYYDSCLTYNSPPPTLAEGAFYSVAEAGRYRPSLNTNAATLPDIRFDASRCSAVYGNANTVQPQAIKGFIYIVLANSTKTDIQVDIDKIATDVNNKQDKCIHIIDTYVNGTSGYRIWSDGYCKQWGYFDSGATQYNLKTINFLKPFINTDYQVYITVYNEDYTDGGVSAYHRDIHNKTTSSFQTYFDNNIQRKMWEASGYLV